MQVLVGVIVLVLLAGLFTAPMLYGFWRGRNARMISGIPAARRRLVYQWSAVGTVLFALICIAVFWR